MQQLKERRGVDEGGIREATVGGNYIDESYVVCVVCERERNRIGLVGWRKVSVDSE